MFQKLRRRASFTRKLALHTMLVRKSGEINPTTVRAIFGLLAACSTRCALWSHHFVPVIWMDFTKECSKVNTLRLINPTAPTWTKSWETCFKWTLARDQVVRRYFKPTSWERSASNTPLTWMMNYKMMVNWIPKAPDPRPRQKIHCWELFRCRPTYPILRIDFPSPTTRGTNPKKFSWLAYPLLRSLTRLILAGKILRMRLLKPNRDHRSRP